MTSMTTSIADGDPGAYETLVLGIGNILWADEGFGIRTVETLNEQYTFDETTRVMDGGTQGIFLLPWVRSASRLLMFDAVDFGLEPGTQCGRAALHGREEGQHAPGRLPGGAVDSRSFRAAAG